MNFGIKLITPEKIRVDVLAFFVWKEEWPNEVKKIDRIFNGFLKKTAEKEEFKGKEEETLVFNTQGRIPSRYIILSGLGKRQEFDLYTLRKATGTISSLAKKKKAKTIGLSFSLDWPKDIKTVELSQAITEGIILSSYKFLKYKSRQEKEKEGKIEEVFLLPKKALVKQVKKGVNLGKIFSSATTFARDLVNEPASVTTPTHLAGVAQKLAKKEGISCKIFDKRDCKKLNMGAFLGVARGSDEPPKFIRLEYKGGDRKVALIGKGITFDTGGLSIKSAEAMATMKMDMAGAAAILGVFSVLPILKPKVSVLGFIAATENMPSGKAIKPGDIVSTFKGKTIEIINTDAEGRLTLADALPFAEKEKPEVIIDLATLTGAIMVALGQGIAGVFGNNEKITEKIKKASQKAGEKLWPMPLEKEYRKLLDSEVADIKNVTDKKYGGAITAALFLEEFIDKTSWVHIDIAGPAFEEKGNPLYPKGGTGFGIRTILNFLKEY